MHIAHALCGLCGADFEVVFCVEVASQIAVVGDVFESGGVDVECRRLAVVRDEFCLFDVHEEATLAGMVSDSGECRLHLEFGLC
jgi:hypothetical protein